MIKKGDKEQGKKDDLFYAREIRKESKGVSVPIEKFIVAVAR